MLKLLRRAGITLKRTNCSFFQPKVDYLGHVITPGKLSVATENTKSFAHSQFPRNTTQIRSFLGAANVYRRFVTVYSGIARPLNAMLRKDAEPHWDSPTNDELEAFETLKRKFVTPPILGLPKANRPYMIDTDASAYQLGATLLQHQNETEPNEWTPIGYWSNTLTDCERNYSKTERECFWVVWAVTTLRPYIEGLKFTIRTDHDALRWLMTLTDSSGRLMRWRLRLSEFDFTITYRPGRVHQVPDALSRLISPDGNDDKAVDDEIPTYGDHEHALVTTRHRAANTPEPQRMTTNTPMQRTDRRERKTKRATDQTDDEDDEKRLPHGFERRSAKANVENGDEALDDVLNEDLDIFDFALAYTDDGRDVRIADVPVKLTRNEILDAQRHDDFCQTVRTRQSRKTDSAFYEDEYGLLRRRHPTINDINQILLPETLRPRVLDLAHYTKLAGHPGQTRMYHRVRSTYNRPQMAADIYRTVRTCNECAKNRVKLRKCTHSLRLFPAQRPLESLSIDILGPLTKTKKGYRFLLVITDRFTKLTQVIPLRRIDAYTVAVAFVEAWIFKYRPPKTLISNNGKQFEVPLPVASGATYEGRDRGVNPISVVTECDWHSKGCGRRLTGNSHADPEG